MTQPPQSPRQPVTAAPKAPRKGDVDRAMALRDVLDHAVKVEKETRAARWTPGSSSRRTVWVALLVVATALSGYSWFARPEFIWGPKPTTEPARVDAEARFGMYMISRRIESAKKRDGSYPATLTGIAHPGSGIQYRLVSDSVYELLQMVGGKPIMYRSDTPAATFLGNAAKVIIGPGK